MQLKNFITITKNGEVFLKKELPETIAPTQYYNYAGKKRLFDGLLFRKASFLTDSVNEDDKEDVDLYKYKDSIVKSADIFAMAFGKFDRFYDDISGIEGDINSIVLTHDSCDFNDLMLGKYENQIYSRGSNLYVLDRKKGYAITSTGGATSFELTLNDLTEKRAGLNESFNKSDSEYFTASSYSDFSLNDSDYCHVMANQDNQYFREFYDEDKEPVILPDGTEQLIKNIFILNSNEVYGSLYGTTFAINNEKCVIVEFFGYSIARLADPGQKITDGVYTTDNYIFPDGVHCLYDSARGIYGDNFPFFFKDSCALPYVNFAIITMYDYKTGDVKRAKVKLNGGQFTQTVNWGGLKSYNKNDKMVFGYGSAVNKIYCQYIKGDELFFTTNRSARLCKINLASIFENWNGEDLGTEIDPIPVQVSNAYFATSNDDLRDYCRKENRENNQFKYNMGGNQFQEFTSLLNPVRYGAMAGYNYWFNAITAKVNTPGLHLTATDKIGIKIEQEWVE